MVNHCTSKQEAKQKQKVKQRTVSLQRDGDGVHQNVGAVEGKLKITEFLDYQRLNLAVPSVRLW